MENDIEESLFDAIYIKIVENLDIGNNMAKI